MQTSYVKEFLTMVKTLNYAEAASRLYISHSSLFKHMKALESDLGDALFNRDGNEIVLSLFGQQFLPYAMRLVEIEERCTRELARWRETEGNTVTLLTDYKIVELISLFRERYPQYVVHNQERDTTLPYGEILSRGECDLILLCDGNLDQQKYEKIPMYKDYMAAVIPADHPLAGLKTLHLEQLCNEDFVLLTQGSSHDQGCQRAFNRAQFTPNISMTCARGNAVVEFIARNGYCSVMLERLTGRQRNEAVSIIRLEPEIEVEVDFWLLRDKKHSPAVQAFIECIKEHAEAMQ